MTRPRALADEIARVARALSPGALDALVEALRRGDTRAVLPQVVATPAYRQQVDALLAAWARAPGVRPESLALALEAAAAAASSPDRERVCVVWTGPASDAVPVRRTDQALLELVRAARRRLMVVSYAVYRVESIATALIDAAGRGVRVALVLESEVESGGGLSVDGAATLGRAVLDCSDLYTWPASLRPSERGRLAALHAKCAVADGERLLVSSANLTEFALGLNMELGLLVAGGQVPGRVRDHLENLIGQGVLVRQSLTARASR